MIYEIILSVVICSANFAGCSAIEPSISEADASSVNEALAECEYEKEIYSNNEHVLKAACFVIEKE